MIIRKDDCITVIEHDSLNMRISGNVRLMYEESGLTIIIDSIPVMFFNRIPLMNICSEITIEL